MTGGISVNGNILPPNRENNMSFTCAIGHISVTQKALIPTNASKKAKIIAPKIREIKRVNC